MLKFFHKNADIIYKTDPGSVKAACCVYVGD